MDTQEVCRLCLKKDDLIWVFDKRRNATKNLKEIVYITTGVEIIAEDPISQRICIKCYQIVLKMFQFRQQSLQNDEHLKKLHKELSETKSKSDRSTAVKPLYKVHPSVTKLFKEYPLIKLPTLCLDKNLEPFIFVETGIIESYFEKKNLSFQEYTQYALQWGKKVATKKTSAIVSVKNNTDKTVSIEKENKTKSSNMSNLQENPEASTSGVSTPSDKEKVDSIAIKINKEKDRTSYEIVSNDRSDQDGVKSFDGNKPSTSNTRKPWKRKLADSDFSSEPEPKKLSVIEAVGLSPKKPSSEAGALCVERSVALFICDVCNSIQYSEWSLKRHKEKHLNCQFCKAKFKTMNLKTKHIEASCVVKNIMNNLPSIPLERVDNNVSIRQAHGEAFKGFPQMKELKVSEPRLDDEETETPTKDADIIEIISDEESGGKPKSATETGTVVSSSNPNTTASTSVPSASTKPIVPPVAIQEMSISSSVVKPDIKIKNSNLLELIDPTVGDIKIVKDLLVRYKDIKLEADGSTQTELPSSDSINIHRNDHTAAFTYLKQLLIVYKIPIEIKEGLFDVKFSYQEVPKRQKKLDMWNDLVPVDVKHKPCAATGLTTVSTPKFRTYSSPGTRIRKSGSSTIPILPHAQSAVPQTSNSAGVIKMPNINFPSSSNMSQSSSTLLSGDTIQILDDDDDITQNKVVSTAISEKVTQTTVASENVTVPLAGTIRVKKFCELT